LFLISQIHDALGSDSIDGVSETLQRHAQELHHLAKGGLHQLQSSIPAPDRHPLAHDALRWCSLARDRIPDRFRLLDSFATRTLRLQPCLRDLRPEHLLYCNEKLTGLIDFGAMGRDTICLDLARLLGEWIGSSTLRTSARELLASHIHICNLSDVEIELVVALALAADLLIGARWVRWIFVDQIGFPDAFAVAARLRHAILRLEMSKPLSANRLIQPL
jgi:homoserine kinase type II